MMNWLLLLRVVFSSYSITVCKCAMVCTMLRRGCNETISPRRADVSGLNDLCLAHDDID